MAPDPGRRRHLGVAERGRRRVAAVRHQPVGIGAEQHDLGVEEIRDVTDDHGDQLLEPDGPGDLAAELVERVGAGFALASGFGLIADPHRELADEDADDQVDDQRHDVLRLRDRERVDRLDEEEVVDEQAEHGGDDRRDEAADRPPSRARQ